MYLYIYVCVCCVCVLCVYVCVLFMLVLVCMYAVYVVMKDNVNVKMHGDATTLTCLNDSLGSLTSLTPDSWYFKQTCANITQTSFYTGAVMPFSVPSNKSAFAPPCGKVDEP